MRYQESYNSEVKISSNPFLELRILTGLHAGARMAIDESVLLGSDLECDVVLQDNALSNETVRIALISEKDGMRKGWSLQRDVQKIPDKPVLAATHSGGDHAGITGEQTNNAVRADFQSNANEADESIKQTLASVTNILAFDAIFSLDTLSLTVSYSDAPWPTEDTLAKATMAPDEVNALDDAAFPGTAIDANGDVHADDSKVDGISPLSSTSKISKRLKAHFSHLAHSKTLLRWAIRTLILVLIVTIAAALLRTLFKRLPSENAEKIPDVAMLKNHAPAEVTKVLEQLGLSTRLHLATTPDGLVEVVGWVSDTAQHDALAAALSRLSPMPAMRIFIEADALRMAQSLANEYGSSIDVGYEGEGKITMMGMIDSDAARTKLAAAFASQLPGAMLINDHLLAPDALAEALHKTLVEAGLNKASVNAGERDLRVVLSTANDPQQLSSALAAFHSVYGKRVTVLVQNGDTGQTLAPHPLPFAIVSINSGDLPSVIVGNGIRLLPGGEYQGYRLLSVSDTEVIFDGASRVVVTR